MAYNVADDAALARVAAKKVKVKITDHALVRFIEREKGISLQGFRSEIESASLLAANLGASSVRLGGTELVLVKNNADEVSVVTALPKDTVKAKGGGRGKLLTKAEARRNRARDDRRFSKGHKGVR